MVPHYGDSWYGSACYFIIGAHYSSGDDGESGQVNTLIIGAGDAGATIAREIERYHKRSSPNHWLCR